MGGSLIFRRVCVEMEGGKKGGRTRGAGVRVSVRYEDFKERHGMGAVVGIDVRDDSDSALYELLMAELHLRWHTLRSL